jgi:hypothetical protein
MKKLHFLLFMMLFTTVVSAQETTGEGQNAVHDFYHTKLKPTLERYSFSVSIGTPSYPINQLELIGENGLRNISVAEINISRKINEKLSFGLSLMGALGNSKDGYYTTDGSYVEWDDGEYEIDDDEDEENDLDAEDEPENIMGTFTYKISEKVPFFAQVAAGYAIERNAPAYSVMLGYDQPLFAALGLRVGVRYSDVLQKKPDNVVDFTTRGLKAEVGLSWNF